jgi:hypothetical protein
MSSSAPTSPTTVGPPLLGGSGFLPAISQGSYISNNVDYGPDGEPPGTH